VIDVMIFITAFLLLSVAYALSRYHNRRAVSVSQFGGKVKASERIIENLSPGHLIGLTENLSEEEAYRVIEPYVGKWVEVSGSVKDTTITGKSFIMLINAKWTHHTIVAVFREQEWRTHVEDLKKGDRVRIAGQVKKANILALYLENCEVVESKFGD
jgi:RecG-like helicase